MKRWAPLAVVTLVGCSDAGDFEGFASSRPLASPPSYWGSVDNSAACSRQYGSVGFEPGAADRRYPLFLYFAGTGGPHDTPAPRAVTEAMARRGFVALAVEYDNTWVALASDHLSQLNCLYGAADGRDLLSAACGLPQVDCELGIATWGHSQGALVAHLAANYDSRVRATWTTGYGGATEGLFPVSTPSALPKDRLRVVNGEAELASAATVPVLNQIAGFTSAECPDDGRKQCLRGDGSGWIIVLREDLAHPDLSSADHCWFDRRSCLDATTILEPNWVDPTSTRSFALESNADWVANRSRTPLQP